MRAALCIGINDYPGSAADLRGCVNDARAWTKVAVEHGYGVQTALDSQATKANMVSVIQGMVADARFGDRLLITYSGHGTYVPDLDGDEEDRRDEALVMHDYQKGRAGLLTDDELHGLLSQRRHGVRATVVSDSCHSGTMARFASIAAKDDVRRRGQAKFVTPADILDDVTYQRAVALERGSARHAKSRTGTVLVSGCADHEVSYDAYIDGRYQGAMTAAAMVALKGQRRVGGFYRDLRKLLPSSDYPQTPQLTASAYQKRLTLL